MATGKTDLPNELSVNVGYIRSQFKSPFNSTPPDSTQHTSKWGNNFVGSVLYSRQVNEQLAWGVGLFPSAGLAINYDDVNLGFGVMSAPKVDLKVYELSGGVAYKFDPNWSAGLGYRITYSTADFTATSSSNTSPSAATSAEFKNMKGADFLSFRAGTQYKQENWGVGLNVRTPVKIKVKGDVDLKTPLAPNGTPSTEGKIATTLPLAISLGGHYKVIPELSLLLDYTFLNYSSVKELEIDATVGGTQLPKVPQEWKDAHVVRVGADYMLPETTTHLRAGYLIATQIVNKDHAMPTSESPGIGHLFTLGAGTTVANGIDVNGALMYGFINGSANSIAGDYKTTGFGAHAGVDWTF